MLPGEWIHFVGLGASSSPIPFLFFFFLPHDPFFPTLAKPQRNRENGLLVGMISGVKIISLRYKQPLK